MAKILMTKVEARVRAYQHHADCLQSISTHLYVEIQAAIAESLCECLKLNLEAIKKSSRFSD